MQITENFDNNCRELEEKLIEISQYYTISEVATVLTCMLARLIALQDEQTRALGEIISILTTTLTELSKESSVPR